MKKYKVKTHKDFNLTADIADKILEVVELRCEVSTSDLRDIASVTATSIINLVRNPKGETFIDKIEKHKQYAFENNIY